MANDTVSEKRADSRSTRKRLYNNWLKDAQRTKR